MDSAWLVSGATVENRSPRDRVVRTVFFTNNHSFKFFNAYDYLDAV